MKSQVTFFLNVVFGINLVLMNQGCSQSDSGSSQSSNALFVAVGQTLPKLSASASLLSSPRAYTISDSNLNVIYQVLRSYTYPSDEGVVDMTNIYKVLWEAGRYIENAGTACHSVTAFSDTSAPTPFIFKLNNSTDTLGHTYNCGYATAESGGYGSSVAHSQSADGLTDYTMATYKWSPNSSSQIAMGQIQVQYNATSGDLALNFAQTVYYPAQSAPQNGFVTRTWISGNKTTHSFSMKIGIGHPAGTMTYLVGKGISQGSGNYFLFRSGTNYYCIPATASEADIAALSATNYTAAAAGNCSAYASDVQGMVPFTSNDVPSVDYSAPTFSGGVAGTKDGTTPLSYMMFSP